MNGYMARATASSTCNKASKDGDAVCREKTYRVLRGGSGHGRFVPLFVSALLLRFQTLQVVFRSVFELPF